MKVRPSTISKLFGPYPWLMDANDSNFDTFFSITQLIYPDPRGSHLKLKQVNGVVRLPRSYHRLEIIKIEKNIHLSMAGYTHTKIS
jgi:hypothetical protein